MHMSELELIDSHVHLDFDSFDDDREDVLLRAKSVNVCQVINVGTNLVTSRFSAEFAAGHNGVFAAAGIHPHDSTEIGASALTELRTLLAQPKVVALGEIGLDYFKMYEPQAIQEKAFQQQLELAIELDVPIIIHTRAADDETLAMLRQFNRPQWQGVFHCFPGDEKMARAVLDMGFHISFTGNITFKKSQAGPVVQYVPLDRMLLETDCPFMAPVPKRGKRNEPAFVRHVGEKVAELKNLPLTEVAAQTTKNTRKLFNLVMEK